MLVGCIKCWDSGWLQWVLMNNNQAVFVDPRNTQKFHPQQIIWEPCECPLGKQKVTLTSDKK
jgi:hypothetical protein